MKVTLFSNYLNHHQMPICREFLAMADVDFKFVATIPILEERLALGYEDMNQKEFVIRAYEDETAMAEAERLAKESDIAIVGGADEKFVRIRNAEGKPTFKYSERFFKTCKGYLSPTYWKGLNKGKPVYMLSASAFTAADFALAGAYKDKCYKWGYFPKVNEYGDIESLVAKKQAGSILWAGRMIDWKHPEAPVLVAERLKKDGYDFTINMIGTGELTDKINALIEEKGLKENINMLGSMSPDEVREHMEKASVFLFTSNKQEGWGAVLNESMNSGCAVVASHAIGSVPFLLKDNENGLIYRSEDIDDLYKKVKYLLDNPNETKRMGIAAYKTLAEQWNAKNAAARFMELSKAILSGEKNPDIFPEGVCSKAAILKNNWY